MLTKDDIEQIAKLLEPINKRLNVLEQGQKNLQTEMQTGIREGSEKIKTVDLKVEASQEFNKKAHTETMEILLDIGEINYKELQKELKDLKKRVEQLEGRHQN